MPSGAALAQQFGQLPLRSLVVQLRPLPVGACDELVRSLPETLTKFHLELVPHGIGPGSLRDEGCVQLVSVLERMPLVDLSLRLAWNGISDAGCVALARLAILPIRSLEIGMQKGNAVSAAGRTAVRELATAVKKRGGRATVDVGEVVSRPSAADRIQEQQEIRAASFGNTCRRLDEKHFEWTLQLRGVAKATVTYFLHPSFRPRVVELHNPPFSYTAKGWGTFQIAASVEMPNGHKVMLTHDLSFDEPSTFRDVTEAFAAVTA